MTAPPDSPAADRDAKLLAGFDAGHTAALARAVSIVENHRAGFDRLLARLQTRIGRARRIGITGPPGAGKSTLVTELAREYRAAGLSVGIIAVDPTSPFTGGALLGDRIRMESVALDSGVFIRSMATRGSLGGLAAATREVADVVDAFGIERILIETVGVGQTELDIARTADTSVVVLVPESGDSIQTLKAGLMEIADIFVVNKGDRPGADRLRNELELMLGLRGAGTLRNVPAHHGVDLRRSMSRDDRPLITDAQPVDEDAMRDARTFVNPARAARAAANSAASDRWTPPVLRTTAAKQEGIGELIGALDRHFGYLETSGTLGMRRRARLRERVVDVVEGRVRARLWHDVATNAWLDGQLGALEAGATNPFHVADALLAMSGDLISRSDR
ncbi:MAG TPA: methylmalonyl Co-A mutase-associated GTPase MeaB [Gemmatimonadaceae bacterium]|jgi:LAO/AO transport system kinase|nr:methylmalonyl Co-A mutase-associated GTPase MeaB [Gemmatimonadaceae bacterium]